jgi:hypothetical protein
VSVHRYGYVQLRVNASEEMAGSVVQPLMEMDSRNNGMVNLHPRQLSEYFGLVQKDVESRGDPIKDRVEFLASVRRAWSASTSGINHLDRKPLSIDVLTSFFPPVHN